MIADKVMKAIHDGASIVNASLGLKWQARIGGPPNPANAKHDSLASYWYTSLRGALQSLDTGSLPLLVLSAGNDGVDAKWDGFSQVANDFPENVLVVGASTFDGGLWTSSNHGSLVGVAAPGEGVYGLDGAGNPVSDNGTSLAAAYVTGLAGLLESFDPALSPGDVKDFIVDGAAGGEASIPVINAYKSLRRAAEEPGAPLCRNDVWATEGTLRARRGDGAIEALASVSPSASQLEVLHGGKHVLYIIDQGGSVGGGSLGWDAASRSWMPMNPPANYRELRGGTTASIFGQSHGIDSLAYVDDFDVNRTFWYQTGDTEEAPVRIRLAADSSEAEVGKITVEDFPVPVKVTCLERDPDTGFCYFSVTEQRKWLFRLGYPQFRPTANVRRT